MCRLSRNWYSCFGTSKIIFRKTAEFILEERLAISIQGGCNYETDLFISNGSGYKY